MKCTKTSSMMFLAVCIVITLAPVSPANAADNGWYLEFGAGGNLPSVEYFADPGFRLSASGGYNFEKWLGLELETGFMYNNIDIPEIDFGIIQIDPMSFGAKQIPVLLNFMVRYENESKWEPYAGFGTGGVYIMLPLNISTFDLAYQPKIGVRRIINESMSIGIDYKYLGFYAQSILFSTPLGNHSLMIELNKRF